MVKKLIAKAFLLITIYILTVDTTQYLLTEHFYILDSLGNLYPTLYLLFLVIVFALLRFEKVSYVFLLFATVIFSLALFSHLKYTEYYDKLQTRPKVKSVVKNWGIQGSFVTIYGKNFGETWRPGKVTADGMTFNRKYWSDTKLIVEQPVPSTFGELKLTITNYRGEKSKPVIYKIKNPTSILKAD